MWGGMLVVRKERERTKLGDGIIIVGCHDFCELIGCDQIRPLWRHYFDGLAAILFVVDLADGERMKEAVGVLRDLVGTVEGVPVVV